MPSENTKPQTLWPWSCREDCLVLLRLWSADQTKIRLLLSGSVTLDKSIIDLCLHSPAGKRKEMLFPCCRGALEIKFLSETDGEYGKRVRGSGSQPTPQCQIFLAAHGPADPPRRWSMLPDNSSRPVHSFPSTPCQQLLWERPTSPSLLHKALGTGERDCPGCSSHPCSTASERAQPGSAGVFDNLCRVKMIVSEQQCRAASVIYYLQTLNVPVTFLFTCFAVTLFTQAHHMCPRYKQEDKVSSSICCSLERFYPLGESNSDLNGR